MKEPVIIHWLGEMFDPALEGYWGHKDHLLAMDVCLDVLTRNTVKVDGIKVSLLDKDKEIALRRRLPKAIRMYTGDDFNFAELIEGDEQGYSDALLGIFDSIAPAVSTALSALADNDPATYREILAPTVPLSRHIFCAPTRFYKTGVVFMAWLNGHQDHFVMIGGQQSARHVLHFAELFRLADAAGCCRIPNSLAAACDSCSLLTASTEQWVRVQRRRRDEAAALVTGANRGIGARLHWPLRLEASMSWRMISPAPTTLG